MWGISHKRGMGSTTTGGAGRKWHGERHLPRRNNERNTLGARVGSNGIGPDRGNGQWWGGVTGWGMGITMSSMHLQFVFQPPLPHLESIVTRVHACFPLTLVTIHTQQWCPCPPPPSPEGHGTLGLGHYNNVACPSSSLHTAHHLPEYDIAVTVFTWYYYAVDDFHA